MEVSNRSEVSNRLIVVGAGTAGSELAIAARKEGWEGEIVLVGEETHLPYHRPPLSKAYLSGKAEAATLDMRPVTTYDKSGVLLRLGIHVTAIDRSRQILQFANGEELHYKALALCLGSRARPMVVPGLDEATEPENVHYLRTRVDADAIRANLKPDAKLVIIGGGYVGLEVAASARATGVETTLLETLPRVLARVTGPEVSRFYESVHRDAGVDLRTDVTVERVICESAPDNSRRVVAVVSSNGERFDADVLVIGVGGLPNSELASAAGLVVDGGIVVDESARTSDPHIVAAGDCTVFESTFYGRRLRLESVPNALEQARVAAATVAGKPKAHTAVPWFWSDQYDLKLQMVGLSQGYDECAIRGSMEARSFTVFYLQRGRILAIDSINRPQEFMVAKRLILVPQTYSAALLTDEGTPLKALLPSPT